MPLQRAEFWGALELDVDRQCLCWPHRQAALTPKAFALLQLLIARRHQLISKEDLLAAVWPGVVVQDIQVKQFIADLRRSLGDDAHAPRFIETVRSRGYRFIGEVGLRGSGRERPALVAPLPPRMLPDALAIGHGAGGLWMGRDAELLRLSSLMRAAQAGQRSVAFVVGDAGIGKTSLVERFFAAAASSCADARAGVLALHGRCLEMASGEPLMPFLEALDAGCDSTQGHDLLQAMRLYAPQWLLQLPWREAPGEPESLRRSAQDAADRARMPREFVRLIAALARDRPLLLWLDGLQHADADTLALFMHLANETSPARVLLIGSVRLTGTGARIAAMRTAIAELHMRSQADVLRLEPLDADSIAGGVRRFWPGAPAGAAEWLCRRSEGHPLALWAMLRDLIRRAPRSMAEVAEDDMPSGLREWIEQAFVQLDLEDRWLLEIASVAGPSFAAQPVAHVFDECMTTMNASCGPISSATARPGETRLEALACDGAFLRRLPRRDGVDDSTASRYGFTHGLTRQVIRERLTPHRVLDLRRILDLAQRAVARQSAAKT